MKEERDALIEQQSKPTDSVSDNSFDHDRKLVFINFYCDNIF